MKPHIDFVYSRPYDSHYRLLCEKRNVPYPELKELLASMEKIKILWDKEGERILAAISRITGLPWKKDIDCYVVGRCRPISNPLSIPLIMRGKKEHNQTLFLDTLTHELIHNIFIQNQDLTKSAWAHLQEQYPDETQLTRNHIFLHAIHAQIYRMLFSEERLQADITRCKDHSDYARAWQIVEEQGSEQIVERFKQLTQS